VVETLTVYCLGVSDGFDLDRFPAVTLSGVLGPRFEEALIYAAHVHGGQRRKGPDGIPYIAHLLGVCALVLEDGGDEDEAIAALLHDAVEDQGGAERLEDIRVRFGERVATIVQACTDAVDRRGLSSEERKRMAIEALPDKDASALRVSLADKLYNARTILHDYRLVGDELWERFNVGRDAQLSYYRRLADTFNVLTNSPMAVELADALTELERAVGGERAPGPA